MNRPYNHNFYKIQKTKRKYKHNATNFIIYVISKTVEAIHESPIFVAVKLNARFISLRCVLNRLPCVKGGGFCGAKDGGIVGYGVTVAVILIKLKTQSLSRLRRQLPLHKGAYI